MKTNIINKESGLIDFTIQLEDEDIENGRVKAYNQYKNSFKVPGFRNGKVPMQIIQNHYGEDIFDSDVPEMVIDEMYDKAIEELDFEPIGAPEFVEDKELEPWTFRLKVATAPGEDELAEVKLDDLVFDDSISEAEIEEELQLQLQEYAPRIPAKTVGEGDEISLNETIYRIAEDVTHKNVAHDYVLNINDIEEEKRKDFLGQEVGFHKTYEEGDLRHVVTITEINTPTPVELNDDFAKSVSFFDTLDEYKDYLKKVLRKDKILGQKIVTQREIIDDLLNDNDYELAEKYLEESRSLYEEKDFDLLRFVFQSLYPEEIGTQDHFLKTLRNQLLLSEYLKKEDVQLLDEDLQSFLIEIYSGNQYKQIFFSQIPEKLKNLYLIYAAEREKLSDHYVRKVLEKQGIELDELLNEL